MLTKIEASEEGYNISLDIAKMLGLTGASTADITLSRGENGDNMVITSIDATVSMFGMVNATVNLTNNNPGTPVDVSAADGVVASVISALGYTDEGQFLSDLAQSGYLTTQTADQPAE